MRKKLPTFVVIVVALLAGFPVLAQNLDSDFFSDVEGESHCLNRWKIEFSESELEWMENGYFGTYCDWVPGLVSDGFAIHVPMPRVTTGHTVTAYSPGYMEDQVAAKGLPSSVRGIALQNCYHANNGHRVLVYWPNGQTTEHRAVDCARRQHMYDHVIHGYITAEVDFQTMLELGYAYYDENGNPRQNAPSGVTIEIMDPELENSGPVDFRQWWKQSATFVYGDEFLKLNQIQLINPEPNAKEYLERESQPLAETDEDIDVLLGLIYKTFID